MYALLPENSVLSEPLVGHMPDLVFLFFNGTGVLPVYHPRGMCLSASNEIGVLREGPVVLSVVMVVDLSALGGYWQCHRGQSLWLLQ